MIIRFFFYLPHVVHEVFDVLLPFVVQFVVVFLIVVQFLFVFYVLVLLSAFVIQIHVYVLKEIRTIDPHHICISEITITIQLSEFVTNLVLHVLFARVLLVRVIIVVVFLILDFRPKVRLSLIIDRKKIYEFTS